MLDGCMSVGALKRERRAADARVSDPSPMVKSRLKLAGSAQSLERMAGIVMPKRRPEIVMTC